MTDDDLYRRFPHRWAQLGAGRAAYIDALFDARKVIFNFEDASAVIDTLRGNTWIVYEILAPDTAKPWTLYLDSRK